MTQWRNDLWRWCGRLIPLAVFLTMLTAYAKERAYHYNEGLVRFLEHDDRFLQFLAIDLAICGIYYAARHDLHLGKQTARLEDQLKELRRLEGSLSTRRKGPFPQYLSEIGKLAKRARHVDILVDCLDYGSFFLPRVHQEVHDKICFAVRKQKAQVRMLVCGEVPEPFTGASGDLDLFEKDKERPKLFNNYSQALLADTGFQDWVRRLDSQESDFEEFRETWFKQPKPDSNIFKAAIKVCLGKNGLNADDEQLRTTVLQIRQLWFAEELQRAGIEIRGLSVPQPMFFWLKYEDGKAGGDIRDDGLFTFAKTARGPSQLGYSTHDPDLLDTFWATFDEKWKDTQSYSEPDWLKFLKKQCLL